MNTSPISRSRSLRALRNSILILGAVGLPIFAGSAFADATISYQSSFDELAPQYDLNPCYALPGPNSIGAAEGACDGAENAWVNPVSNGGKWMHRVVPPWSYVTTTNPPTINTPPEWQELTQNEFIFSDGSTNGFNSYGDTRTTKYFEYGRYGGDFGQVEQKTVPDVVIGDNRQPTPESLQNLYDYISTNYGDGGPVDPTYYSDADYQKIVDFARRRQSDPNRAPYSWNPIHLNTCKTFAHDAISAGQQP